MSCGYAYLPLVTRWLSTLVNPADEPSRGGLPDERTLAWRPQPLTRDQFFRAPEWPLALSTFYDPVLAIEELRRAMPAWNPPSAQGCYDATQRWQFPPVWADPINPGYMCSIPPAARLITWTLGQRDFQVVRDIDPSRWSPIADLADIPDIPLFTGSEPLVAEGVVVPPPPGWEERPWGDTEQLLDD